VACVAYELLFGMTPFMDSDKDRIEAHIMARVPH
jgi:hypothetical protein